MTRDPDMYEAVRRTIDVISAGAGLLILAPFAIPLIIALRLTGEGEIFYRQTRIGYLNRPFKILKFATMLKNSINMPGGAITLRDDPRITPLGGLLMKSKVNELPQLWNVLIGNMTIVGPRPLMPGSFEMYSEEVRREIYKSRPGITGIASLVFRDEAAYVSASGREPLAFYRDVIYPYKGQLELWYVRNKSPVTDLKILALTAWLLAVPSSPAVFRWFATLPARPPGLEPFGKAAVAG